MSLRGKVAIVTGAGSGIGEEVARRYAEERCEVVVSDVVVEAGERVAQEICRSAGEACFVRADVSKPEDCESLVRQALDRYGRLDIACNNAGIGGETNKIADYSIEGWRRVIEINLSGVFHCMKYEIPAMVRSGGGAIVNIASILGQVAFSGAPAYVAAKHGVVGLTKNAAVEYAEAGIRVNAVAPGFISTPMIHGLEEDAATNKMLVSLHPIGRLGLTEEVAELVLWLSSEKASFVTGGYYPVDGGYLSR